MKLYLPSVHRKSMLRASIANCLCAVFYFSSQSIAHAQAIAIDSTEYGHLDIQGMWIYEKRAPLERPEELGTKGTYSESEVQEIVDGLRNRQLEREKPSDPNRPAPPAGETITNVADANFIPEMRLDILKIEDEYRTSIITDPPNGRIPRIPGVADIYQNWVDEGFDRTDGPEIRPANDRCLNSPAQLPLVNPIGPEDSRTVQIIQTKDYVVLNAEYATSLRIIPLNTDSSPIIWPQWRGVSSGYWEGDKLIVETSLFREEQSNLVIPSSEKLHVIEEFTLLSPNELLYQFTFTDENTLAQSFTGEMVLDRMEKGQ